MDNQLPKDWKWVKLGEACEIVSGNTPKGLELISNKGNYQFYKVSDMNLVGNESRMNVSNLKLTLEEIKKLKIKVYPKGTVIFPKRGGAILTNKKRILSKDASFDLNVMGILPNDKLLSSYLFYWIQKLDLSRIYDGSNVPQINNKNVAPLDFPLPPKPTQLAIVSKIEELFSELEKGIESLFTAKHQLKTYRQSVFKWAFEGKLSESGFSRLKDEQNLVNNEILQSSNSENPDLDKGELPKGWKTSTVGELFDFVGGGTPSKKEASYWIGNIPWASVKDIKGDYLNDTEDRISEEGLKKSASNIANPNEVILITRISPGKTIITNIKTAINQDLKIVKPKFKTTAKFVYYVFKGIERECVKKSSGTTVLGINLTNLKEIEVPNLDIEEQNLIVHAIESRLSVADKMEESITQSLQQAEALKQSILKKAFEGRLI